MLSGLYHIASPEQTKKIRQFIARHNAEVTGYVQLAGARVHVMYQLPVAEKREHVTAPTEEEYIDITYGPAGSIISQRSSWSDRRSGRQRLQAVQTGSLKTVGGKRVTIDGTEYQMFS